MKKILVLLIGMLLAAQLSIAARTNSYPDQMVLERIEIPVSASATVLEADPIVMSEIDNNLNQILHALSSYGDNETSQAIMRFLTMNKNYFSTQHLLILKEQLSNLDPETLEILTYGDYKNPDISLCLSIMLGCLGADRFYIGDIGKGVGKLLTFGGLGIWWIIDIFKISNDTKDVNYFSVLDTIDLLLE